MNNLIPQEYPFPDYEPLTRAEIIHTCIKMKQYFREYDNILISISGGSDSDCIVHLVCTYFPEYLHKCHFVFVDTGLEYIATKKHLDYLESKYNIKIERIRGKSVVWVCKNYGVPILSKIKSYFISLYIRGVPCGEKYVFYDGVKSFHAMQFTEKQKTLAKYIKSHNINISSKCCDYSKKTPLKIYIKQNNIDLVVTGERKAEGGQRALCHKTCFETHKDGTSKYMPLWGWLNAVKQDFKKCENITFSDCYELWGMKRTGCVGCPFNLNISDDLYTLYLYEPKLFRACIAVFGKSYYLTDKFGARRKRCISPELETVLNYPEYVELWDKIKKGCEL